MTIRIHTALALVVMAVSGATLPATTRAAAIAFQNPATASWGNWKRGSSGSVYVHYDVFNAASLPLDDTPDVANSGTLSTNGALLITKKKGASGASQAFVTGSSNIYSFESVLDFDLVIQPRSAHTNLGHVPITVALQISILGSDIDDSSIQLLGRSYDSKTVLSAGSASGPGGTGTGVDNEYLYLWHLAAPSSAYNFDFAALSSSLSLDAVAVDIGRTAVVVPPTPAPLPTPVPLPVPALLLGASIMGLIGCRNSRRTCGRGASSGR